MIALSEVQARMESDVIDAVNKHINAMHDAMAADPDTTNISPLQAVAVVLAGVVWKYAEVRAIKGTPTVALDQMCCAVLMQALRAQIAVATRPEATGATRQ